MSAKVKYPLIQDTNTTRQRTTITPGPSGDDAVATLLTESALSTSDGETLKKLFGRSPIYNITNESYRVAAKAALSPALQQGDPDQFPAVDFDYGAAPKLPVEQEKFEGAYYPYLVVDYDNAGVNDGSSAGSTIRPNDNFGVGAKAGDTTGPSQSSADIALTDTISSTVIGAQPGQSNAHVNFPGAVNPTITS